MSAPPESALTTPVPKRAAPSRPSSRVAKRPAGDPLAQTRDIDKTSSVLHAIARASPSPLLAPWLPGVLIALSRRGAPR